MKKIKLQDTNKRSMTSNDHKKIKQNNKHYDRLIF